MKLNKLSNEGFSAVEIVIAVVIVVAVVGLGVFAFNNRSKNSKSATTSNDEVALINSDNEAEAVKASAAGYTVVGNATSGSRKIGALVCTTGPSRLKVVFVKNGDKDTSTDVRPVLVFARNGKRTGQIYGAQSKNGRTPWWLGSLNLVEKSVGNHAANDTVKVEYNGKVGPTKKWSAIQQC